MDKLFSEFPPVSTEKWIETIKKDLKGKDIERLNRITIDGLKFLPFYRRENTENLTTTDNLPSDFPFLRTSKNNNSWLIRQDFDFKDLETAESQIKRALKRDVEVIGFDFGDEYRLSDSIIAAIIDKHKAFAFSSFQNIEKIYYFLKDNNITDKKIFLNYDPVTFKAFTGGFTISEDKVWTVTADILSNEIENIKPVGINITHYANAGATHVQQIAFALAIATEYLDFATELNLPLETVLTNIYFNFAFGSEYFMEIAKIRAFRYLFAKLAEAYDKDLAKKIPPFIHGTTLRRNKTIYDPYVNMLRTTIETFAGILAGVDSFNTERFDIIFAETSEFSERIAVNQQIILKNEAFADKVVDPAGGSYYVENLTKTLIEKSWDLFLKIQEKGGFCDALAKNFIFDIIDEIDKKEKHLVNTGKISILGTTKYPNRNEKIEIEIHKPVEISDLKSNGNNFKTLKIRRLAEDFEQMRINIEKLEKKPKVFLLTYGNVAMRRARADFAGNFYAVAGFEIIDNTGFDTIADGINAAKKSMADIIVLCSSDDEYLKMAEQTSKELKGKIIVIAGNPETRQQIEQIGIKNFIHIKSNLYEELDKITKVFLK